MYVPKVEQFRVEINEIDAPSLHLNFVSASIEGRKGERERESVCACSPVFSRRQKNEEQAVKIVKIRA